MKNKLSQLTILWVAATVIIIGIPLVLWLVPPPFFTSTTVDISRGATVSEAAAALSEKGVVYTPELVTVPLLTTGNTIIAGTYKFDSAVSATTVVNRLLTGEFRMPQTRVVIPEGFTNQQIADRLAAKISSENFSREAFIKQAREYEGYLYPDTYQLHENASTDEVIKMMRENFDTQIAALRPAIENFDKTLSEVVKMASLIEREAADYEVRRRIAGVLWKRFEKNMPLQVDAVFVPLLGKNTYELTRADLQTDSPYNLYINTGLPPTPIANPGIESIRAAINPIETQDLYYLSDASGNFYFAETLAEHNQNKQEFLTTDLN